MTSIKLLRGQVRQIVKELLPDVFNADYTKMVQKQVDERLSAIEKHIKSVLEEINERSKETQSYVVRNLALSDAKAQSKVDDSSIKQQPN